MPINIAHNGAVSDRSKRETTGPLSFAFSGVSILAVGAGGMIDLGGGPGVEVKIGPGDTLGVSNILGTSTATNPVSIGALGGPGQGFLQFTFHMEGNGGLGSKRSSSGKDFTLQEVNDRAGFAFTSQLEFVTSHENPNNPNLGSTIDGLPGEIRHSIGNWQNGDFGTEYQSSFPRPGGSSLLRDGITTNIGHRDAFVIFCDAVSEGGMSDATGIFRINRGGLIMSDANTGQEIEAPTNHFEWSIKVVA